MSEVRVGDAVRFVDDPLYEVIKFFPDDKTVLLRRINSSQPAFRRLLSQIWTPPPITNEVTCSVDLPTSQCLCPDPEPPRAREEAAVQVALNGPGAMDQWCSLTTDYSTVDKLSQAFEEARSEAFRYHAAWESSTQQTHELQQAVDALTLENRRLAEKADTAAASLEELKRTHNELMEQSLRHLDELASLRARLSLTDNASQQALLAMLRNHLLSLPKDLTHLTTPDDTLYHYLCCQPSASDDTLALHAKTLLRFLHPDKTGPHQDDSVDAASRLVPLITLIKRVLLQKPLRLIYDHCGLMGLHSLLLDELHCPTCQPTDPITSRRLPQGRVEYPHLYLLFQS